MADFILVKRKTKRGTKKVENENRHDFEIPSKHSISNGISEEEKEEERKKIVKRVRGAIEHLKETDYFTSFYTVLLESLKDEKDLKAMSLIVCYGLGSFVDCMISRYQLAFLVCLSEKFLVPVEIFDPIFSPVEEVVLSKEFNLRVLSMNEEGKRSVDEPTLFYLPHCAHQLTNNLIYSNWHPQRIKNCIIASNSFTKVIEEKEGLVNETLSYIARIFPMTKEFGIVNCFPYSDIFNEMAIHIFPPEKFKMIPEEFWQQSKEPVYTSLDYCKNTK